MKRVALVLSVVLVLMAIVAPVSADLPPGGWWGGIQVANLGTSAADIQLTVYESGNEHTDTQNGIAPGGSANFITLNLPGTSWRGAGIASASEPIAAVATVTNLDASWHPSGGGVAGGTARALYPGVNEPDMTVFFPLVKNEFPTNNAKTTSFFVQNAGDSTATLYADFVVGSTHYRHEYAGILPGEMTLIDPSEAGFPANTVGSLVVTSTVPLAGVVNEYKIPEAGDPALDLMATRGFAPSDAGNTLLFPIFKNNFGSKHVGIQVQNTGSVATTVYMTATETSCLTGATPGTFYANLDADPGSSVTFLGTSILQDGCLASVVVTADQPIVGTGSESRLFTSQFTVYFGFKDASATGKLVAPLYKQDNVDNNRSGLQVQNVSDQAATCTLVWATVGTSNVYTYSDTIAGNSASTYWNMARTDYPDSNWTGATRVPNGTNNSVVVECSQNIVGVVQESRTDDANKQDAGNYETFNQ